MIALESFRSSNGLPKHPEIRVIPRPEVGSTLHIGSFAFKDDRDKGINLLMKDRSAGGNWNGVFGLWLNAASDEARKNVAMLKGDVNEKGEPSMSKVYSSMMETSDFLRLVDRSVLSPQANALIENPTEFRNLVGSLCHIRAPIDRAKMKEFEVPESLVSEDKGILYMQNLDPFGHGPMTAFVREAKNAGIPYLGVTSMNDRIVKEPEISRLERALVFCHERGVELLLRDPYFGREGQIKGSFAIVDIMAMKAVRDGHIPISSIEKVLGVNLDKTDMKEAKYKQISYPSLKGIHGLTPRLRRWGVLMTVNGYDGTEVRERLKVRAANLEKRKDPTPEYHRTA